MKLFQSFKTKSLLKTSNLKFFSNKVQRTRVNNTTICTVDNPYTSEVIYIINKDLCSNTIC